MSFQEIIFYLFSLALLLSAGAVVIARNTIHSALFLVLTFFTTSAIWLLLEAEFLAITLILVYVGAVMVLFLFVVMMLDVNLAKLKEGFIQYLPVGLLVALVMATEMIMVVGSSKFGTEHYPLPVPKAADYSNTKDLGSVLYTEYVLQFELAAVILLVAIIAAIALTMRRRPNTKYQTPGKQMMVKKADRLRIVKMDSE
ncbi:MAG: NADH-quinone oxidoreductase subunit J [Gammaproteobacteria bacterium]|nr:NADH-quinone oxidoreductase subunit J [Gammaproteobacteria bacterium]